jgi:tetratricopeptide (TPR) repeat protein
MEGEDLNDMGISWNYLQRPKRALPLLQEAIEIHHQLGNRRLEAIAISNRAAAYYALGPQDPRAYERAVSDAQKSVAIAREIEDKLTEVWSLNWEGLAQQKLHRPELAFAALKKADSMLGPDRPRECVSTWGNLGYLLGKDLGRREDGVELLEKAIALMRELMRDKSFTRAFGGRTLAESEAMLREIQSLNLEPGSLDNVNT